MKALVTGADGFVGRWLVRHLEEQGDHVWRVAGPAGTADAASYRVDLRDAAGLAEILSAVRPDAVYHLAAVSFGPDAQSRILDALDITVGGTIRLIEACRRLDRPPTLLVPSSSEVYGLASTGSPLSEADPLAPVTLYGATKLAQEAVALAYHRAGDLPVVLTRAFNHIGPGQREVFVVPSFAAQLAAVATGVQEPILRVGNLAAERDFCDVRDVVAAYRLLVAGAHTGEPVNVASGSSVSIGDLLQRLVRLSGQDVDILVDAERLRPFDAPRIVGDARRLHELTGWRPTITLEQSLADIWSTANAKERSRDGVASASHRSAIPSSS